MMDMMYIWWIWWGLDVELFDKKVFSFILAEENRLQEFIIQRNFLCIFNRECTASDIQKRVQRAEIITLWCFHYRCNIPTSLHPSLPCSRSVITACFGGRLSRLRKPKYFILSKTGRAFMSRRKGVRVVKGVHGNPRNNLCKISREVTFVRTL